MRFRWGLISIAVRPHYSQRGRDTRRMRQKKILSKGHSLLRKRSEELGLRFFLEKMVPEKGLEPPLS